MLFIVAIQPRVLNRGIPIIEPANTSATNMLIFTVSVIGTTNPERSLLCKQNLMHAKKHVLLNGFLTSFIQLVYIP